MNNQLKVIDCRNMTKVNGLSSIQSSPSGYSGSLASDLISILAFPVIFAVAGIFGLYMAIIGMAAVTLIGNIAVGFAGVVCLGISLALTFELLSISTNGDDVQPTQTSTENEVITLHNPSRQDGTWHRGHCE